MCQSLLEQRDTLTEEKNLAVQELDRATKACSLSVCRLCSS